MFVKQQNICDIIRRRFYIKHWPQGIMSEPNSEAYAASKEGLLPSPCTRSFVSQSRITKCNFLSWIETRDYAKLRAIDHEQHLSRRVGKPDDIARACLC